MMVGAVSGEPASPPKINDAPEELPWEHLYVDECIEALNEEGVTEVTFLSKPEVRKLPAPRRQPADGPRIDQMYCHVPQALHYVTGPGKIDYTGYVMVNCDFALALAEFERIVQEEVKEVFGPDSVVTTIKQIGTYACRRLKLQRAFQSEHSFGNAIDVIAFRVFPFGWVYLDKHWEASYPAQEKPSEFLHRLAERLIEEAVFTNVLTPDFDRRHANHFHFDLAPED